jgi:hypothetical protein
MNIGFRLVNKHVDILVSLPQTSSLTLFIFVYIKLIMNGMYYYNISIKYDTFYF